MMCICHTIVVKLSVLSQKLSVLFQKLSVLSQKLSALFQKLSALFWKLLAVENCSALPVWGENGSVFFKSGGC